MNVLAIGYMTGKDIQPHLKAELEAVAKLREEGLIRDVFLKTDESGPILILNDVDRDTAKERLAALPVVQEHIVAFDLVELESLPG